MKTDDPKVQLGVIGVIAIIAVAITVNFVYDKWGNDSINTTQLNDELVKEIKEVASSSKGKESYYSDAADWRIVNDPYIRSLETIENTNSCTILYKLFEDNTAWHARPLLAEKIVRSCL